MKKIICLMLAMLVMMSCTLPAFAETTIPGAGTEINDTPLKKWNAFFISEDFRYNKLDVDSLVTWYMVNAKVAPPNGSSINDYNYFFTCKNSEPYGTKQYDDSYQIFALPKSITSLTFDSENMCFELPAGIEYYFAEFSCRTTISDGSYVLRNANSFKKTTTDKAFTFFPGSFNGERVLLLRNDFDIIDKKTGDSLGSEIAKPFTFKMDNDGKRTVEFTVSTKLSNEYLMHLKIYNQNSGHAEASEHIPYSLADNYTDLVSKNRNGLFYLNVTHFKDSCSDKKTYSDKIIVNVWVTNIDSDDKISEEYFFVDLKTIFDEVENSDDLFSQKKDYEKFPSIEDYVQEFPNFPTWDSEHPLDSIWNIVKWVGDCLITVGKNIIGLFKWLGACLWTIIKNIGIALYNLVVDIRRLLIYLFVPDSNKLQDLIKNKFPSLLKIENSIKAGQTSNSNTSIYLFGHSFDFDFADMPDTMKSYLYTGSTIFLYAVQVFLIVKMAMKFFGVNAGGDEE